MTAPRRARLPKSRQLLDDGKPVISDAPDGPDHFPARALLDEDTVIYTEAKRKAA